MPEKVKYTDRISDRSAAREKWICWGILLFLVVLRQLFAAGIPVFVRLSNSDDVLMVRMAEGLIRGDWLGEYYGVLLMKGCFFPMFLAAVNSLKGSYLQMLTAVHSASCLFFVSQIRGLIRKPRMRVILAAVLMFDPCSFAKRSFQEVYRNSITIPQVLLIFGAIIGLYLAFGENRYKDFLKAAFAGFMMWGFWNTREDAVWLLPFFVTALAVTVLKGVLSDKTRKNIIISILICIMPVMMILAGNQFIIRSNLAHYGSPVRLESVDGEFARMMKTIYSVKPEEEIPYCSVPQEKLQRLYAVSPTLDLIHERLDQKCQEYGAIDRNQHDGEVEDGWFFWSLKWAAWEAGKTDSLPEAEQYYRQIREEIETALDTPGSGVERSGTMPSALMSPWRKGYGAQLARKMKDGVLYIAGSKEIETTVEVIAEGSTPDLFEQVTGDRYIREGEAASEQMKAAERAVTRATFVTRLYQVINPLILLLSLALLIRLIYISIKRKTAEHCQLFLVIAGMWLSIIVMLGGVAYTDITAFFAVNYYYMAGAFPLMLAGEWMILLYTAEHHH